MKVILEGGNKSILNLINELKLKMRRNKIKYSFVTEAKPGRPKVEKIIEPVKEKIELNFIEKEIKKVKNEKQGRKKTTQKAKTKVTK